MLPTPIVDLQTMIGRCLRLSSRNVDALITALALPIVLMLVFVYLFGGAIDTGTAYVDYVVPGVLLVCAGFGVETTATTVNADLTSGVVDRFRSLDIRGEAILAGHVVASVLRNLASTVLVFAVALAIGFRSPAPPAAWIAAAGVFAAFVFALSWLCAALGVLARSPEAAMGLTFAITLLPYASSAFVPIRTMPGWLQGFARHQPVTPRRRHVAWPARGRTGGVVRGCGTGLERRHHPRRVRAVGSALPAPVCVRQADDVTEAACSTPRETTGCAPRRSGTAW